MADIRPKDLPAAGAVNPTTGAIIIDNGAVVERTNATDMVNAAIPLASQADAEAGTDNAKRTTPLRVAQYVTAQLGGTPLSTAFGVKANASALGVTGSADNLGTFTGTIIPDNQTAKAAIQALETSTELRLLTADAASTANDKGASLVGYRTNYTVRQKLSETVSVKDFGATGDGITDDTASIMAAIAYATTNRCDIYVPSGVYITGPLILNSASYSFMPCIFGSGINSTIIRKKAGSGTGAVLRIGDSASAVMPTGITIRDLTIDGLSKAESDYGIRCYSFVRSYIQNVRVKNAGTTIKMDGGVSWTISKCEILDGNFGIDCNSFSGVSNAQYPNSCLIEKSVIQGHANRAIRFNNGRFLKIADNEIDTCGTVSNPNTGGILIDANIDSEDGGANPIGAIIERNWFELIAGAAAVVTRSGHNTMRDNNFGPNPNSIYDIRWEGGTLAIDGVTWTGAIKTPAIFEDIGTQRGSHINRCPQIAAANVIVNNTKTDVDGAGLVYTVSTLPNPPGNLARAWVSDSTVGMVGNFGALLTGGGGTLVSAIFDGTNWRIG